MKTTTPLTITLLSLSALTACGGGGGRENFTAPPPPETPTMPDASDSSTATPAPTTEDPHNYWTKERMKNAQPVPMPEMP
ncbi:hypothetical protein [Cardiobacterium valvarum]|uniref:Lipoprotein n=1 Tax=Cardiobacterium valvarum F0432 TaxID=797473 RepID=G9ZFB6_9GAMM|nr:hypothetical protein [Cardiobacterium valvarum]EHM54051.1 hypothetical protein HMPREF9080_01461 [Cardiobacterium valvarum F0432]